MSKQIKRLFVTAVLIISALLAAACDNKSSGINEPAPPELPGQSAVDQTNANRLTPSNNTRSFTVKGVLSIKGLTLLNSQGKPVAPAKALPELDARLLDPEEDILAQVKPGANGAYTLVYKPDTSHTGSRAGEAYQDDNMVQTGATFMYARLVVSGRAQEDLNGDGTGGDTFSQAVPLTLLAGYTVKANLDLNYNDQRKVDPALVPKSGGFLLATLAAVDADGAKQQTSGTFFASNITAFDTNGNSFIDFSDYTGADEDRNGLVDNFDAAPADPGATVVALAGQITAVDSAALTIRLRDFNKVEYTLQLQQFTPVELWDLSGAPIGVIPFGPQLIGRYATAEGPLAGLVLAPYQVVVYQTP